MSYSSVFLCFNLWMICCFKSQGQLLLSFSVTPFHSHTDERMFHYGKTLVLRGNFRARRWAGKPWHGSAHWRSNMQMCFCFTVFPPQELCPVCSLSATPPRRCAVEMCSTEHKSVCINMELLFSAAVNHHPAFIFWEMKLCRVAARSIMVISAATLPVTSWPIH